MVANAVDPLDDGARDFAAVHELCCRQHFDSTLCVAANKGS